MDKTKVEALKKVAKEMNEVMGLDPAIDLKAPYEQIYDQVLEASGLVEPDDEFSEEAWQVINNINSYSPERVVEKKKEDDKKKSEAKKPAKKPAKKKAKPTRAEVMKTILMRNIPYTKKEMVREMVALYGGSEKEAKFQVDNFVRLLVTLGLLVEKDGKYAYTNAS